MMNKPSMCHKNWLLNVIFTNEKFVIFTFFFINVNFLIDIALCPTRLIKTKKIFFLRNSDGHLLQIHKTHISNWILSSFYQQL